MKIMPNLHFNGDCEQAIELYERAFGGQKTVLLRSQDVGDGPGGDRQNQVYHAEMSIGGQRILLSDTDNISYGINVSLLVAFDRVQEVQAAYEILKEGARIITPLGETAYSRCFVSLIDRYGVRWELIQEA